GWYAAINVPLSTIVYLVGAGVMAWFVSEVVKEAAGFHIESEDDAAGRDIWSSHKYFWAAVWGVSIDALVTGPGKTSATAGWSELEVWLSFPIVGFVVFLLVMAAGYIAKLLRDRYESISHYSTQHLGELAAQNEKDRWRLGLFFTAGTWFEILIFSYFGLLAIALTVRLHDLPVHGSLVFIGTGLVGFGLFLPLRKKVRATQVMRANIAFGSNL
ncbi:MAG: hypothetical protein GTO40_05985, partial [Deltaproteobacteria bacterium]|nr:hypothetical protein [Deltaproteobacteria bacterium]